MNGQMLRTYWAAPALCLVATAALAAAGQTLGPAVVALVYLLVVFVCAMWFGRGPGIVASVCALLGLNYLFTFPYTLVVTSTREGVSLLVFLVVAEATSGLVIRARARQAEAELRAWEASALHAVSFAMTHSTLPEEILRMLPERIVAAVGVPRCAIYLPDGAGSLRLYSSAGRGRVAGPSKAIPAAAVRAFTAREPVKDVGLFVPLGAGTDIVGVLHADFDEPGARSDATQRLLMTLARQMTAVVERLRLWRETAEVEILRKTNELQASLMSAVSHDIRDPLFSIRVAATVLQQKGSVWGEDKRREMLDMINLEASRLSRLVGNLLNLSRIEAGALRPTKESVHLAEVIAQAVNGLQGRLGERGVSIVLPQDLPLIPLDVTQMEDVFVNLLDNAARYSPSGTEIRVTAERRPSEVVVQVENDGPAIPAEAATRIFNRFITGEDRHRRTGLGLAICKALVEAQGGRIWVERPGEPGARLAFSLPLSASTVSAGDRVAPR